MTYLLSLAMLFILLLLSSPALMSPQVVTGLPAPHSLLPRSVLHLNKLSPGLADSQLFVFPKNHIVLNERMITGLFDIPASSQV